MYWEGRRDASSPPVLKSAMRRAQARVPGCGRVCARWPRARPRAWRGGRGLARSVACPGPCPGSRWPAGARPARGSRTFAAQLRTGGEEESARTGDSNPGCNCLVRGYSPSMHFFWGGDMNHYSPPLPFRRGRAGAVHAGQPAGRPAQGSRSCALCGVPRPAPRVAAVRAGPRARPRAWRGGHGLARSVACPGPRPGSCWPAGARPARGSRMSTAQLRTGGEEESARTGDSNPGCNCLMRGYSPSMHFFWGGDMPHYSPPLPFQRGRAGARACLPARGGARLGGRGRALGCDSPAFLASLCSPFSGVFQFLDRYISLARKIEYVTIKPMTNTARYLCFSWLMCNRREKAAWPAITVLRFEKNRSSGNVQKGQNFGLALNIGPAFSDRF